MNEIIETEKRARQVEFSSRIIARPVEFLIKHNVSPNKISYIGFLLSIMAALLIGLGFVYYSIYLAWIIPFLLFWAGAFDLFDGEVARKTNNVTESGAFLDSNLDRLSDAILILGLTFGGLINYFLGFLLLFLVIMISYIRSRAENEGVQMKGIGIMERGERILLLLFGIILEMIFYYITFLILGFPIVIHIPFISRVPITPVFLVFIILYTIAIFYTVIQRLVHTFKSLKTLN
ncbi:MAG: CDP-alcohol phosphatidyltransferase family protein [Candidatus Hermodarchaeota archaeon]